MSLPRRLLKALRAENTYWLGNLPETVRRGDAEIPLADASVDDIVMGARHLEDRLRPLTRQMYALRDLHDLARSRGALGADRIADVFVGKGRGRITGLPIISADQRLAETRGIKGCIFGKAGIGKTSLLWFLDPERTLFFDLEAGDLAIEGWAGDTIRPRTWPECRDFAVFIGGPNPALREDQPYSQAHYDYVCQQFGDPGVLERYETVFIDSITVAGRLCFQWCKGQPQSISDRTGKPDLRGTYGLHGQEMIAWLTHLQHTRAKNVWFVGILDEKLDDFNRRVFSPQIEGAKTGLELPGIVDQVITLAEVKDDDGASYRAFVCHTLNPWGYPAKDRSGRLDMLEEPRLDRLMAKIHTPVKPAVERLEFGRPSVATADPQPSDENEGVTS